MESPSKVIWHRNRGGWSIDLHESTTLSRGDRYWVFLTGRFEGLWRSRHMAATVFLEVADAVTRMHRFARNEVGALIDNASDIPKMPQCRPLAELTCGPCRIEIVAHRNEDDSIAVTLAVYDRDDDSAPVLYAVAEDIDRLAMDLEDACFEIDKHAHS
jgi:hypothetical protein